MLSVRLLRNCLIRENDHPGNDFPGNIFPGKKPSGKVTIRETTVSRWFGCKRRKKFTEEVGDAFTEYLEGTITSHSNYTGHLEGFPFL